MREEREKRRSEKRGNVTGENDERGERERDGDQRSDLLERVYRDQEIGGEAELEEEEIGYDEI